jgi:hypothetical protein
MAIACRVLEARFNESAKCHVRCNSSRGGDECRDTGCQAGCIPSLDSCDAVGSEGVDRIGHAPGHYRGLGRA